MATLTLSFKPPQFKGRANEDIDGFLAKLTSYFGNQTTALTDNEKAFITCQCLDEAALGWVKTQLETNPSGVIGANKPWRTYSELTAYHRSMHKRYYDPKEDAVQRLLNITQGKNSILSYNKGFTEIAARLDRTIWTTGALLEHYKNGLSKHIKYRLVGQIGSGQWNLDQWMANAKLMEQGEYNLRNEHKVYMPRDMEISRTKEPQYVPMEVDKRTFKYRKNKKGKLVPNFTKKFSKKKSNSNCHNCGKPGHFAKNCRVSKPHRSERSSTENNKKEFKRKALNEAHASEESDSQEEEEPQSEEEPESERDF